MKISRNSWHYRLINQWEGDWYLEDYSLCPYVRKVIFALLGILAGIGVVAFVIFAALTPYMAGLFYLISGLPMSIEHWTLGPLTVLSVLCQLAILVGLSFSFAKQKLAEAKVKRKARQRHATPKEPNIFVAYYRALHDKVCPMLEFTDE